MHVISLYDENLKFVCSVRIPAFASPVKCIIYNNVFYCYDSNHYKFIAGLAIATAEVVDAKNVGSPPKKEKEEEGQDSLFEFNPKTLDEASDDFLMYFGKAKDFDTVMKLPEEEYSTICHHVSGQYLRNTYFLWWYPNHGYKEWPKNMPPLVKYFEELGISHADDMSDMILRTAYRKHHGLPILEHMQTIRFKNHWKKNGFPDGIFRRNK
jgi:hypothetical protein